MDQLSSSMVFYPWAIFLVFFNTLKGHFFTNIVRLAQVMDPDPHLDPHWEKQLDPDPQKIIRIHSPGKDNELSSGRCCWPTSFSANCVNRTRNRVSHERRVLYGGMITWGGECWRRAGAGRPSTPWPGGPGCTPRGPAWPGTPPSHSAPLTRHTGPLQLPGINTPGTLLYSTLYR